MLTAAAVALLLNLPTEPPAKPERPGVKFLSVAKDGMLIFGLSNPNAEPLPYLGYQPDSFEGGLKKGIIAPLYRVEVLRGKEWNAHKMGWCGTGLGEESIPRKGKATFAVGLPGGDWERFRVGLTWFKSADRKESAIAWSDALSKNDVTLKKP
jgi:hypothetical protein